MVVSFKIENYRSIKEAIEVSFTKTNRLSELHLPHNAFNVKEFSLLRSIILYGRNASGKSNLIRGLMALGYLVTKSDGFKLGQRIPSYDPFILDRSNKGKPVKFELQFLGNESGLKYDYIIEFTSETIEREALFFYPQGVRAKLYERSPKSIDYGEYFKGPKKLIEEGLLSNQLYLSKAATTKVKYLNEVYEFFTKYFYVATVHDTEYDRIVIRTFSELMLKDDKLRANLLKLLSAADTNITDFTINQNELSKFSFPDSIPEDQKRIIADRYKYDVKTSHLLFEGNKMVGRELIELEEESYGTKKLMVIGSLIIDTLARGGVIVIDELDKGLHPLLTRLLIKLFHSPTNNPNNAQLVFATHDSTLLDNNLFRRDQICFVDKEYEGGSYFYKLSDIKGIRKDIPIDKWYLSGRYRAIPVISEVNLDF